VRECAEGKGVDDRSMTKESGNVHVPDRLKAYTVARDSQRPLPHLAEWDYD
jgi:hypothetical protein